MNSNFKQTNVLDLFEEGISKEKLKRIEMRKDALIVLNIKNKYDSIAKNNTKTGYKLKDPILILRDGRNLFGLSPYELSFVSYVDEIKLKEIDYINIETLSHLPKLVRVDIRFSTIILPDYLPNPDNFFFDKLEELDLSFNNLENNALILIKNMKSLRVLNLSGNNIDADIPDLSELTNLTELNLSYNRIESYFMNLDLLKKENMGQIGAPDDSKIYENRSNMTEDAALLKELGNGPPNNKTSLFSEAEQKSNESTELKQSQLAFEEWKKYLKTNLQEFYHKLCRLKKLETLNLSHNKIHFFDIDPFYLQKVEGFSQLRYLDLSHNLIEEEISILLVMNVPSLEHLDVIGNPIVENKVAFENIEFEIFKIRNILLISEDKSETVNMKSDNFRNRRKSNQLLNEEKNREKPYYVKKYKVPSTHAFEKQVKNKIMGMLEARQALERELLETPGSTLDLVNSLDKTDQRELLQAGLEPQRMTVNTLLKSKKNKDKFFLTSAATQEDKTEDIISTKNEAFDEYQKFLELANTCFGKQKHYKQILPITNAYQKLRFLLTNLPTQKKESSEPISYMKPTISNEIHNHRYIPDNNNFKHGKLN